jgi:hypothetical protein
MNKIEKLKELIASAEIDADKFYRKGNGAAGTRLRKIRNIKESYSKIIKH